MDDRSPAVIAADDWINGNKKDAITRIVATDAAERAHFVRLIGALDNEQIGNMLATAFHVGSGDRDAWMAAALRLAEMCGLEGNNPAALLSGAAGIEVEVTVIEMYFCGKPECDGHRAAGIACGDLKARTTYKVPGLPTAHDDDRAEFRIYDGQDLVWSGNTGDLVGLKLRSPSAQVYCIGDHADDRGIADHDSFRASAVRALDPGDRRRIKGALWVMRQPAVGWCGCAGGWAVFEVHGAPVIADEGDFELETCGDCGMFDSDPEPPFPPGAAEALRRMDSLDRVEATILGPHGVAALHEPSGVCLRVLEEPPTAASSLTTGVINVVARDNLLRAEVLDDGHRPNTTGSWVLFIKDAGLAPGQDLAAVAGRLCGALESMRVRVSGVVAYRPVGGSLEVTEAWDWSAPDADGRQLRNHRRPLQEALDGLSKV